VRLTGPALECKVARRVLQDLYELAAAGHHIDERDVRNATRLAGEGLAPAGQAIVEGEVIEVGRRKRIIPRTATQRTYLRQIRDMDLTFGVGPAGTGKTYLAVAMAVQALRRREVGRIILTRPAVEAGERLGFLPGTFQDKIDPYLRPLTDALQEMMEPDEMRLRMERGSIEVAPLAYMRGRTLNDSFIILDEAQNTSAEQMKMFLTRLGFGAKMVVTGDITQVDLAAGQASGLRLVQDVLDGVDDIYFARLNSHDVVRHRLVSDIVNAYEAYDARTRDAAGRPQRVTGSGRRDDRGTGQPDRRATRGRRAQ
jgi:phosphate starvation-inducible PhoH-like protein